MLPLCSLPVSLAFIGTISYVKARAARANPFPGSFRVELGVGLEEKEEGERGGPRKVRNRGGWSLAEDREGSD